MMEVTKPDESKYHYWLSVQIPDEGPHGMRHAFEGGRRWDGRACGITVCGVEQVPMAEPGEIDWILAPTCAGCMNALIAEQGR